MKQYTENKIKYTITKVLSNRLRPISKEKIYKKLAQAVISLNFDDMILYLKLYYDHIRNIHTFIQNNIIVRDTRHHNLHSKKHSEKNQIGDIIEVVYSLKAAYILLETEELLSVSTKLIIQNLLEHIVSSTVDNKKLNIKKINKSIILILSQNSIQNLKQRFSISKLFAFLTKQYSMITLNKIIDTSKILIEIDYLFKELSKEQKNIYSSLDKANPTDFLIVYDKLGKNIDMSWYNTQNIFTRRLIIKYAKNIATNHYIIPNELSAYLIGITHTYIKYYYLQYENILTKLINYVYSANFAFTGKGEKLYVTQANIKQALTFLKKIYLYLPNNKKYSQFNDSTLEQIKTSVSEHPNIFSTTETETKEKILKALYKFAYNISTKLTLLNISHFLKTNIGYTQAIVDFKKLNKKYILSNQEKVLLTYFLRNIIEIKKKSLIEPGWENELNTCPEFSARYIATLSIYKTLLQQSFITKNHTVPNIWFSHGDGKELSSTISLNILKNIINIESHSTKSDIKEYNMISHVNLFCNKPNNLSLKFSAIFLKDIFNLLLEKFKLFFTFFTKNKNPYSQENVTLLPEKKSRVIRLNARE